MWVLSMNVLEIYDEIWVGKCFEQSQFSQG